MLRVLDPLLIPPKALPLERPEDPPKDEPRWLVLGEAPDRLPELMPVEGRVPPVEGRVPTLPVEGREPDMPVEADARVPPDACPEDPPYPRACCEAALEAPDEFNRAWLGCQRWVEAEAAAGAPPGGRAPPGGCPPGGRAPPPGGGAPGGRPPPGGGAPGAP